MSPYFSMGWVICPRLYKTQAEHCYRSDMNLLFLVEAKDFLIQSSANQYEVIMTLYNTALHGLSRNIYVMLVQLLVIRGDLITMRPTQNDHQFAYGIFK